MGDIKRRELLKIAEICKGDTVKYPILKETVQFIKKELKLGTLVENIRYLEECNNSYIPGSLTSAQIFCMDRACSNIKGNNIRAAYQELCDFIESDKTLEMKEFDMVEKIIIRFLVNLIEKEIDSEIMGPVVNKICIVYGKVAFIGVNLIKTAERDTIDIFKEGVRLTAIKLDGCNFKFVGIFEGFKTYSIVDDIG